jgi:hypothetical protein
MYVIGEIEPEESSARGDYEFGCDGGDNYEPDWCRVLDESGNIIYFIDEDGEHRTLSEARLRVLITEETTLYDDYDFNILAEIEGEETEYGYHGIYMSENLLAETKDFITLEEDIKKFAQKLAVESYNDELVMRMLSYKDVRIANFNAWTNEILYPFTYVLNQMDGSFENNTSDAIDRMTTSLRDSFTEEDLNPYLWADL